MKALVALVAVTAASGALIVGDHSPDVGMYAVDVAVEPGTLDRSARILSVTVLGGGDCVRVGQADERSRFDHFDIDSDDGSVRITAWIRRPPSVEDGTPCSGVGSMGFIKTVELPDPIGDRALISHTYPRAGQTVLALPRGKLATPDRFSDRKYVYLGERCRAARELFTGPPEYWCQKTVPMRDRRPR